MHLMPSRRALMTSLSLAGAAAMIRVGSALADEPPETTAVRLARNTNLCLAPMLVAEELLRAEGFGDIRYIRSAGGFTFAQMIARGELDFGISFAAAVAYH